MSYNRAQARLYYLANKEKAQAKAKKWYAKNKEKAIERSKARYWSIEKPRRLMMQQLPLSERRRLVEQKYGVCHED